MIAIRCPCPCFSFPSPHWPPANLWSLFCGVGREKQGRGRAAHDGDHIFLSSFSMFAIVCACPPVLFPFPSRTLPSRPRGAANESVRGKGGPGGHGPRLRRAPLPVCPPAPPWAFEVCFHAEKTAGELVPAPQVLSRIPTV